MNKTNNTSKLNESEMQEELLNRPRRSYFLFLSERDVVTCILTVARWMNAQELDKNMGLHRVVDPVLRPGVVEWLKPVKMSRIYWFRHASPVILGENIYFSLTFDNYICFNDNFQRGKEWVFTDVYVICSSTLLCMIFYPIHIRPWRLS